MSIKVSEGRETSMCGIGIMRQTKYHWIICNVSHKILAIYHLYPNWPHLTSPGLRTAPMQSKSRSSCLNIWTVLTTLILEPLSGPQPPTRPCPYFNFPPLTVRPPHPRLSFNSLRFLSVHGYPLVCISESALNATVLLNSPHKVDLLLTTGDYLTAENK